MDIKGGFVEIDQGSAHQDITCCGCGLAWRDRYQLVDIVLDDANQDPANPSSHTPADPPC